MGHLNSNWAENLSEELSEIMEGIIAHKGEAYGRMLSVWLQTIANQKACFKFQADMIEAFEDPSLKAEFAIEALAIFGTISMVTKELLHEVVHLGGTDVALFRQTTKMTCSILEKELQSDCDMFFRKEAEYKQGKGK